MKILICDDSKLILDQISSKLSHHKLETVMDACKASELIAQNEYDLVITDISMPRGGGERILNEVSARPNTKVIVFSAGLTRDKASKLQNIGNPAIIIKENGGLHNLTEAIAYMSNESKTLMVIDDEKEIADNLCLELADFATCVPFYSGREASEYLATHSVDLVITDIDMMQSGDVGGGERILSEMAGKGVKVWVYTGGNNDKISVFHKLGAEKVFFKPDDEKLIEAVEKFVKRCA